MRSFAILLLLCVSWGAWGFASYNSDELHWADIWNQTIDQSEFLDHFLEHANLSKKINITWSQKDGVRIFALEPIRRDEQVAVIRKTHVFKQDQFLNISDPSLTPYMVSEYFKFGGHPMREKGLDDAVLLSCLFAHMTRFNLSHYKYLLSSLPKEIPQLWYHLANEDVAQLSNDTEIHQKFVKERRELEQSYLTFMRIARDASYTREVLTNATYELSWNDYLWGKYIASTRTYREEGSNLFYIPTFFDYSRKNKSGSDAGHFRLEGNCEEFHVVANRSIEPGEILYETRVGRAKDDLINEGIALDDHPGEFVEIPPLPSIYGRQFSMKRQTMFRIAGFYSYIPYRISELNDVYDSICKLVSMPEDNVQECHYALMDVAKDEDYLKVMKETCQSPNPCEINLRDDIVQHLEKQLRNYELTHIKMKKHRQRVLNKTNVSPGRLNSLAVLEKYYASQTDRLQKAIEITKAYKWPENPKHKKEAPMYDPSEEGKQQIEL